MATDYDFRKDAVTNPRQAEAPAATESPAMQRASRIVLRIAAALLMAFSIYLLVAEIVR
jgi:hypothetical protein